MIIQAIKLQDPIVKHCPTCEKDVINETEEENEEEFS